MGAGFANGSDPVVLKNTRELFVDDYILASSTGLETRLGTATRAGTAISLDKKWESPFGGAYISVFHNGEKFQMYYRGAFGEGDGNNLTCYAESADGKTWDRPNLGIIDLGGSRENNVVIAPQSPGFPAHNISVFYDSRPGVPAEERYKAVGGGTGGKAAHQKAGTVRALYRFISADGKHWKQQSPEPMFRDWALDSQNVLVWLPAEQCFAIYMRTWTADVPGQPFRYFSIPNNIRTIARSTAKDFSGPWSTPVRMTFGETPMEDLYTNATQPYFRAPQILISMPFRFVPNRVVLSEEKLNQYEIQRTQRKGVSDAVLLTSRGGNAYQRKFMESFVRPGMDDSSWAARSNMPGTGFIQTGPAELSFFVVRGYASNQERIERMALRLDGFAALHAGYKVGHAVTRKLKLEGKRLALNLSTSARGMIKVVVLDETGGEISGFGEADAREHVGDSVDLTAGWKSGKSIGELSGQTVQLKFILQDADLYSFGVFDV